MKLHDHFDDIEDFEVLLTSASANADSDFEVAFVQSIEENYEKYGENMLFSDRQKMNLERIANK